MQSIYAAFLPNNNPEERYLEPKEARQISHVPQTAASHSSRTSMPYVRQT